MRSLVLLDFAKLLTKEGDLERETTLKNTGVAAAFVVEGEKRKERFRGADVYQW